MNDDLILQIMFHAFTDEMEKVSAERGLEFDPITFEQFSEMQKEASLKALKKWGGKQAKRGMVGLSLMGASLPATGPGLGRMAAKTNSPMVEQTMKHVPFTPQKAAANKANLAASRKARIQRDVGIQRKLDASYKKTNPDMSWGEIRDKQAENQKRIGDNWAKRDLVHALQSGKVR